MHKSSTVVFSYAVALLLATTSVNVDAHGFGEQLELDIPLWLWLGGAALTVLLSFAIVIDFLPTKFQSRSYSQVDFSDTLPLRILLSPTSLWLMRLLVLALLCVTLIAGLIGSQQADKNLAPTMIWIVFWVGVTFSVTIFGDVWRLMNPFATVYRLLFRRQYQADLAQREVPIWMVVALFSCFMFTEHLWLSSDAPMSLALLVLAYVVLTITAMYHFGPGNWLQYGEIFSIIFSAFARFSPIKFTIKPRSSPRVALRPPAIALIEQIPSPMTHTVLIVMLLASVTFDGWVETGIWQRFLLDAAVGASNAVPFELTVLIVNCLAMSVVPVLFLSLFWLACKVTRGLLNDSSGTTVRSLMCHYVMSLIPIAIAYHFAHYAMLLLIDGQALIPLISDPFGKGWDLFGTTNYIVDRTLFSATTVWYFVVTMIVLGHMLSVYLAHLVTLSLTRSKAIAVKAGTPILLLMVFYTVISLWVIAQPALQA